MAFLFLLPLYLMFQLIKSDDSTLSFNQNSSNRTLSNLFNSKNDLDINRLNARKEMETFMAKDTRKYVTSQFKECGGFANMMWRFASLYGVGRHTGRRPFIDHKHSCWKQPMPEIGAALPDFYRTTIFIVILWSNFRIPDTKFYNGKDVRTKKVMYGADCCRYDNVTRLQQYSKDEYIYVYGNLLQSYKYFHEFKSEIREIFMFSRPLKDYVKMYTNALFGRDNNHKVCVHTRLGDFKEHFLLESQLNFTQPAIELIGRELKVQFNNIALSAVLIGQDQKFLKRINLPKNLYSTKYIVENLNRAEELYFGSMACDSLVLTASGSTFGWWMGYLMNEDKQNRIFYNIQSSKHRHFGKEIYDYDSFLPEWKRLRLHSNGSVLYENKWNRQIIEEETSELPLTLAEMESIKKIEMPVNISDFLVKYYV